MSKDLGHTKIEISCHINFDIPGLEEGVSG
jgi:hypothetical protein